MVKVAHYKARRRDRVSGNALVRCDDNVPRDAVPGDLPRLPSRTRASERTSWTALSRRQRPDVCRRRLRRGEQARASAWQVRVARTNNWNAAIAGRGPTVDSRGG